MKAMKGLLAEKCRGDVIYAGIRQMPERYGN